MRGINFTKGGFDVKKEFQHRDENDKFLTLHDCCADAATLADGVLTFSFSDGFWIIPTHPANNLEQTVRTDASKVEFVLEKGEYAALYVYTIKRFPRKQTLREEWSVEKLLDKINSGICQLEFLYPFECGNQRIFQCVLHFNRKPFFKEADLEITVQKSTYFWNHLRADCPW